MQTKEFNMDTHKLDELDWEEMSRQINDGCTSGHLDNENGKRVYWELRVNVWQED